MRIRVCAGSVRLFVRALMASTILVAAASPLRAQTTVTLNQPTTHVVYGTVRGGTYANTNFSLLLATRASDIAQYRRHALLKFDTQHTIPSGSVVLSATLTVTVKNGSADTTRNIGVYQVTSSWTPGEVTWNKRKTLTPWTTAGGDLGSKIAQAVVGNAPGTKVSFDVTALVKAAVAGQLGTSRYTRLALIDLDADTPGSYREYHTSSESTTSLRPTLKVTYRGTTTAAAPAPAPSPSGTSTSTLRVLQWNTHHGGVGSDGQWDPERLTRWVARINPDVVSLNEVERYTGWGNTDEPALIASLLKQYTGRTWYYKFTTASGGSTGNGNMILSRFPFVSTDVELLSHTRAAVNALIYVNGRIVNLTSTHLDADSTNYRLQEIGELTSWQRTLAEQRIICGDFNAWPGSTENTTMKQGYYDSWAVAQANNTDITYSGNTAGNTRNSRIDYIYYSHGAGALVHKSSQVFDTRDANGVMPSDHRPVLTIFAVK